MSKLSFEQYNTLKDKGLSDEDISKLADKYGYKMPSENIITGALKTLLVKPAARVAEVVGRTGVLGEDIKKGYETMGSQVFNTPLGDINVEKQKGFGDGGARQIASDAFNSASYLAPVGAVGTVASKIAPSVAPRLVSSAISGATSGYLGDIASNLTEGEKGLSILKPGIGTVVGGAIPVAGSSLKGATNLLAKSSKFSIGQFTGLAPETINIAITNPAALSKAERDGLNKLSVANQAQSSFRKRLSDLSITGKGYNSIRNNKATVEIPVGLVDSVLNKHGITINSKGNLVTSAESVPLKPGDVLAIEDFISQYGKETTLSANGFLNTRKALDNLSDWDTSKSDIANVIAKDLRKQYDVIGKNAIPGLSELDARYAPEIKTIKKIRKNLFDKNGEMLDTTINRIANAGGSGKDKVLEKLEELTPGITTSIQLAHALDDISKSNFKVGAYGKAGLVSAAMSGGNIPVVIASMVISHPKTAIPILKMYGASKNVSSDVIDRVVQKLSNSTPTLHTGDLMLIKKALINHIANLPSDKFDDEQADLTPSTDGTKNDSNVTPE